MEKKEKEREAGEFLTTTPVNMPVDYCVSTVKRDDSVARFSCGNFIGIFDFSFAFLLFF